LELGLSENCFGLYYLNDGTLTVNSIRTGDGISSLYLNGGSLNVNGSINIDNFIIGYSSGYSNSYTLTGTRTITVNNIFSLVSHREVQEPLI
jgi:hypothetical protein